MFRPNQALVVNVVAAVLVVPSAIPIWLATRLSGGASGDRAPELRVQVVAQVGARERPELGRGIERVAHAHRLHTARRSARERLGDGAWTMKRLAAMQLWPLLIVRALPPVSIARSRSASASTTNGIRAAELEHGLLERSPAAAPTLRPARSLPVSVAAAIAGCAISRARPPPARAAFEEPSARRPPRTARRSEGAQPQTLDACLSATALPATSAGAAKRNTCQNGESPRHDREHHAERVVAHEDSCAPRWRRLGSEQRPVRAFADPRALVDLGPPARSACPSRGWRGGRGLAPRPGNPRPRGRGAGRARSANLVRASGAPPRLRARPAARSRHAEAGVLRQEAHRSRDSPSACGAG